MPQIIKRRSGESRKRRGEEEEDKRSEKRRGKHRGEGQLGRTRKGNRQAREVPEVCDSRQGVTGR